MVNASSEFSVSAPEIFFPAGPVQFRHAGAGSGPWLPEPRAHGGEKPFELALEHVIRRARAQAFNGDAFADGSGDQ